MSSRVSDSQALDQAAKSVKAVFDAAQKELADARQSVINAKEDCKRKMSLKCDNCKNLKCKEAEKNCKGFLDAAGKWISKNVLAPVCDLDFIFVKFPNVLYFGLQLFERHTPNTLRSNHAHSSFPLS